MSREAGASDVSSDRLERAVRAGAMLRPAPLPLDEPATLPERSVAPPRPVAEQRPAPVLSPPPAPAPVEEPAPVPVPALAPIPEPSPRRPPHRRAARRVLRLLRPFALPLLHRLDWRIRGAVDRTETSAAVARVEAALATLAARMGAANAANAARLDAADARVAMVDARLAARLEALEAVRLGDHAELLRAVAEARVPDEVFAGLVLRLDAARLQIRDAGASAGALSGEAVALLRSLHPKADDLGIQVSALHAKADRAGLDMAALLVRTDTLVRRNLVPAGADVAVRTDDGYLVVPGEDESQIVAMVETAGNLEPGALGVACALAAEGGLAVDVGAHVGTFTVPLARRVGPRGLIVAVEPTPRTAGVLRRTLALNALQDRVALHECAAGGGEGRARLHVAVMGSHNSLLPLGGEGVGEVEVAVRALDAIVPAGRPACVVKVDAEGMELEVLRGAGRVLAESPRAGVIAEFGPSHLVRLGVSAADWLGAFQAHGFVPWEIEDASGRLRPLRDAGLDAVFSLNLLWLRESPESYPGLLLA
jgi:FkbM family methyltransferase